MNKNEKRQKREEIGKYINLGNSRLKDSEVETLYDIAKNPQKYDGKTHTVKRTRNGWSSDGKYERQERDTYTLKCDEDGIRVVRHYECQDDDGYSDESTTILDGVRAVLNIINQFADIIDAFRK